MNPFFALTTATGDGWQEFPGDLRARVEQTQQELARRVGHPVERRVAASLTHLSVVARLLSPALEAAGTTGTVPDLRAANVRWKPVLGAAPPLAVVDPAPHEPDLRRWVLDTVDAVGAELVANVHVRRGNVASAAATAGRLCPPALPYARVVLAEYEPSSREPHGFRRTSCCLYYRADERAGLCADCVLAAAPPAR